VEQADKVYHIPKILYHWRAHTGSTASAPEAKLYAYNAGKAALQAHFDRLGIPATADHSENLGYYKTTYAVSGQPLVSIVIPNKDHTDELKKCMESIDEKSTYRNYEYIIVENNSTQKETFDYYESLSKRENVRVIHWQGEFNYSAINNYGVEQAQGEYILLLNNDTEMINPDCIEQLLGCCQRDDVGAVGAKLYYEDGTVQHAGVIVGLGGIAGHAFSGFDESGKIYQLRSKLSCDYSAVTAACLITKKKLYEAVGGLDESFKVAFNDIDYCLKLRKLGKLVVYNANARLYHYESKSRGADNTAEKLERFNGEIHNFEQKWSEILLNGDPYYNVNLTLSETDYGLRR
jgi:GT2 family glycosyltransferase